jgi:DNA repair exonuclease SbcCD ATPase subunit
MAEATQMPPAARRRYLNNQRKESRRQLRNLADEVNALQGQFADAMNTMDRCQRELATRLERLTRNLTRLDECDGEKP